MGGRWTESQGKRREGCKWIKWKNEGIGAVRIIVVEGEKNKRKRQTTNECIKLIMKVRKRNTDAKN